MTPRELSELGDRLQRHRHAIDTTEDRPDVLALRADLIDATRAVHDLARLIRCAHDIAVVPFRERVP